MSGFPEKPINTDDDPTSIYVENTKIDNSDLYAQNKETSNVRKETSDVGKEIPAEAKDGEIFLAGFKFNKETKTIDIDSIFTSDAKIPKEKFSNISTYITDENKWKGFAEYPTNLPTASRKSGCCLLTLQVRHP
jgi:hypothetical protein